MELHETRSFLISGNPFSGKRHSPVLFPIVGSLWNNEYRHNGKTYKLSQHGFARDQEFKLIKETDTELRFQLQDNENTLQLYPFPFCLENYSILFSSSDLFVYVIFRFSKVNELII